MCPSSVLKFVMQGHIIISEMEKLLGLKMNEGNCGSGCGTADRSGWAGK